MSTVIPLPPRNRDDFVVETDTDAVGEFRWHMTYAHGTADGETTIVAASSEGFDTEPECIADCYIATGWLPDTLVHVIGVRSSGYEVIAYKKDGATDG